MSRKWRRGSAPAGSQVVRMSGLQARPLGDGTSPVPETPTGHTQLTVTRYGASSPASALVYPTKPNFDAQYGTIIGHPILEASEPIFTIRHRPLAPSKGEAAWEHRNAPFKFTSSTWSQSSFVISIRGAKRITPAEFTSVS